MGPCGRAPFNLCVRYSKRVERNGCSDQEMDCLPRKRLKEGGHARRTGRLKRLTESLKSTPSE